MLSTRIPVAFNERLVILLTPPKKASLCKDKQVASAVQHLRAFAVWSVYQRNGQTYTMAQALVGIS